MILTERDLEFDFSQSVKATKLDPPGQPLPIGMKLVDFVVQELTRTLLVEVKDPSAAADPSASIASYVERLKQQELIHDELTPKARDSYSFLHLMREDILPFVFVFAVGVEGAGADPALLQNVKDRLTRRIRQECATPWKRAYIRECVVIRLSDWNRRFSIYPMKRLPTP